jgi:hypothetical protein
LVKDWFFTPVDNNLILTKIEVKHQDSGFARTNLPTRARWSAKADVAIRQPSGMRPSHLARVFLGHFDEQDNC